MLVLLLTASVFSVSDSSSLKLEDLGDLPGGAVVKNPPANAGDTGSSPGLGRSTCRGATKPMRHNY